MQSETDYMAQILFAIFIIVNFILIVLISLFGSSPDDTDYYRYASGQFSIEKRNDNSGEWEVVNKLEQERTYRQVSKTRKECISSEPIKQVRIKSVAFAKELKNANPVNDVRVVETMDYQKHIIWQNGHWNEIPYKRLPTVDPW